MNGKERCNELKRIRRMIADANGVPLYIPPCPVTDDCPGTCPRCEEELRQLSEALLAKKARGETVVIPHTDVRTAAPAGTNDG